MRPSVRRVLGDMDTRLRTSLQLFGVVARTVRRHNELLLFPVLSAFTDAVLLLACFVPGYMLSAQALDLTPVGLVGMVVASIALLFYLLYVSTTFFNVALAFAAIRALRDERTSPLAALSHALTRVGAIVAYTGAIFAGGVLVAPVALIPRSRAFFNRLLPSLGVAGSLVPLLAIPVLARERCGGLAAIRRSVTLVSERWGETSIGVVGLRTLWLPLAAASLYVFQHRPSSPSAAGHEVLWLGAILVLGTVPTLIDSLVRSLYGSALYVFAVEGVVPAAFDNAEFTTVWRVGSSPAEGGGHPAAPGGEAPARGRFWWAPIATVAALIFMVMAFSGMTPSATPSFRQLRSLVGASAPGLAVNDKNFPEGLRMVWSREFREPIDGLAVRPDGHVAAGGPVTIFVLDLSGNVTQQFPNHDQWHDHMEATAFTVDGDLLVNANLPGTTGTSFIVSGRWGEGISAYDSSGARRWSWRVTNEGDAVDDIAVLRVPGHGDVVAVGHNGFGGLCLIDGGVEKWCNKSVGNVDFVTTLDCDGDGRDEILSLSPHSHPYFGWKLGCYSTEGKLVRDLNVPLQPHALRTFAASRDGGTDLLAWYEDGLRGPLVLAAWTPECRVLAELRLQTEANFTAARISAVRLRAGKGPDIAVALPDGWVVGTSLDGQRWGHHITVSDAGGFALVALATLDMDDGTQELIIASEKTVSAWRWNGAAGGRP